MEAWPIPALTYEEHLWHIADDAPVSRNQRSRGNGLYRSAIPIMLDTLNLNDMPSELQADIEDASVALTRFDAYAAGHLENGVRAIGPMSAILLRTEATSSSQIENLTVGAKNLALELLHEGNSENAAIVVGNVHAMESALDLAGSLTVDHLLAVHKALLSAQPGWESYAGSFRTQLVWVGSSSYTPLHASYVAPQPDLVVPAITDLVRFLQRDDIPVLAQCAIAHAQFETIHPFVDGNGRTGRALIHAVLRNKGLARHIVPPVSAGLLRHTRQYFDALTAYRAGDAAPIISVFAQAVRFASSSGITLIDDIAGQLDDARTRLQGIRRDAAVWKVVPYLAMQPILTTEYLHTTIGLSSSQARRALQTLEQRGIVTARKRSGRAVVWEHRGILDVLDAYAESLRRAY
jgi:Fic family protein